MVYIQGRNKFEARPMAWMDRAGRLTTLRAQPADWKNAEFSPDGRRIAMDIRTQGQSDIWVYDWEPATADSSDLVAHERGVSRLDPRRHRGSSTGCLSRPVDAAGYTHRVAARRRHRPRRAGAGSRRRSHFGRDCGIRR